MLEGMTDAHNASRLRGVTDYRQIYSRLATIALLDRPLLINTAVKILHQLSDIVGIIARYAIMENLYSQTLDMTISPDYQSSLIELCSNILCWFSSAFELWEVAHLNEFVEHDTISTITWERIKEMDVTCRKFNVTVSTEMNTGDSA